jgi:hypothetical protein
MLVTESGIDISVNFDPLNAVPPIAVRPTGKVIFVIPQLPNAPLPIVVRLEGSAIPVILQFRNPFGPISVTIYVLPPLATVCGIVIEPVEAIGIAGFTPPPTCTVPLASPDGSVRIL